LDVLYQNDIKIDSNLKSNIINFENTQNSKNLLTKEVANAQGVNSKERIILDKSEWTELSDMAVEIDSEKLESKIDAAFVTFTCSINDRVPDFQGGYVIMRLMRDDTELTKRAVNLQKSRVFFNDQTIAISFKDKPGSGDHKYYIQFKTLTENFKAYAEDRNLQVFWINENN
jgi:seryl-tRNA synthetase